MKLIRILTSFIMIACLISLSCRNHKDLQHTTKQSAHEIDEMDQTQKTSIVARIKELDHRPVEERIALYHQLKEEQFESYDFTNEDELNMYGYGHLWSNQVKDAIAVFKLLVSEFPNSANTYDSLGEAYLADGNKKLSLLNYEKSLALNPDNFGAEDQIERIKYPDRALVTPKEKFAKVYNAYEYKADLDQLGQKLMEIHPSAFKFITKGDFLNLIEQKKDLITENTTFASFRWHCNEIIASVNCSHTSSGNFYPENDMIPVSLGFPLEVRWTNNQLFVLDPLSNNRGIRSKDQIVKINGTSVDRIIERIYKHIPSQGYIETTKKHEFNRWGRLLIPFVLDFPNAYEVELKDKPEPIELYKSDKRIQPLEDYSIKRCGNNLCLEFLDNYESAVLTVSSFNYYPWNNLTDFENFMNESFQNVKKRGVKNLIVDVRFNGGGSPESSIYLLRYLVDKPFNYYSKADYEAREGKETQIPHENVFKGNVYFLIDGNGNSTTGHFMSLVKVLELGTIIGEELGSNQFCSAGQVVCRLRNTKIDYYVANNTNETMATSLPDEVGILPDYYVTQNIDEYFSKTDAVKKYAFKLIEQQF